MTDMMELADKDFKSYYKYAQRFKEKLKHDETRNGRYKKNQVELLDMKIYNIAVENFIE